MENIVFSFSAVFPVFAVVALGYILSRFHFFKQDFLDTANKFCYKIGFPVLLFYSIYSNRADLAQYKDLLFFCFTALAALVLVSLIIVPLLVKENPRRGAVIQGLFRGDFIIYGYPIALNLFGSGGASATIVTAVVGIPVYNILAVIIMLIFAPKESNRPNILSLLKSMVTNPPLVASILALIFVWLNLPMPDLLDKTIGDFSKMVTPLALLSLGGGLSFKSSRSNLRFLTPTLTFRLVVLPAVVTTLAALMGFRGANLGAIALMFSVPNAAVGYIMAEEMHSDGELSAQLIVFSCAFGVITLFILFFILRSLGLL
ncbi:MAG: AEC family transporter [Christensenellales bacterium]